MTYKTLAILQMFERRWDEATKSLVDPIVSLKEVQQAIQAHNASKVGGEVSDGNPANFFKDLVRVRRSANRNWPKEVFLAGYTGQQLQSGGSSFRFIAVEPSQSEPFPADLLPLPDASTQRIQIESVSLPLASKRLGRRDEPWLIQVLIRLRVFETHLALSSGQNVLQLDHLQTNVKLRGAEIDALFLAVVADKNGVTSEAIVCCEAKSKRDDIVPHQILNQVRAAFRMGITQKTIIPLAVKAIRPSEVWIVEFEPLTQGQATKAEGLVVSTSIIYQLVPPVEGIGK